MLKVTISWPWLSEWLHRWRLRRTGWVEVSHAETEGLWVRREALGYWIGHGYRVA